jgi:hypothetical protein
MTMAKPAKKEQLEFHPHAMERFKRAVGVVAKSPLHHRVK